MGSFKKAIKQQAKLRLAIDGASGSGKTYSGLILASYVGKKVAVIDTEKGSASLYADKFNFDVLEISPPFNPEKFILAIKEAEDAGYDVILIDSITHEWNGEGGILDILNGLGGKFQDWAKVTPRHDKFINTMLQSKSHIIATMRAKADYQMVNDNGRMKVEKQGTAPQQRDGVDFEFTIVFSVNQKHYASATKDRTSLFDGKDFIITKDTAIDLMNWLNSNEPLTVKKEEPISEPLPEDPPKNKTNWNLQMAIDELKKYMDMYDLPKSAYEALEKEITDGKLDMKRITVFHDSCDKYVLKPKYMATEEEILLFLNGLTEIEISKNEELLVRVTALEKSMKISKMKLGILKEEAATCPKRAVQEEEKEPDFDAIPDIDVDDPEKKKGKKDLFDRKLPAGVL